MKKLSFLMSQVLVISCGFCFLSVQRNRAQNPSQDKPIKLKAELVEIDVVVTDKKGRPVTDLRKEDFIIIENKQSQDIAFFSLIRPITPVSNAPEEKPQTAGQPANTDSPVVESGRFVFLILDRFHIGSRNTRRLKDSLLRFVIESVSPLDRLALVSTSGRVAIFQEGPKDAGIVKRVIESFVGVGTSYKAEEAADEAFEKAQESLGIPVSQTPKDIQAQRIRSILNSLAGIAESVSKHPGRKIAIFVSEKLPVRLSEKYLSPAYDRSNNPFENFSLELRKIIAASRRGGLTFYVLDPRALETTIPSGSAADANPDLLGALGGSGSSRTDPPDLDKLEHSRQGMRELAAATGGFTIFTHNDLHTGLRKVMADNEAYYYLGYYPSNTSQDGKFRRIEVRIRNRSDLVVRARKGYIASNESNAKPASSNKEDRVKQALASPVPIRQIKVNLLAKAELDQQTNAPLARFVVHIDASTVEFKQQDDTRAASLEVIVFAYDLNGKLINGFSKTLNMNLKPEMYVKALSEGMNLGEAINLKKAGVYNIRVVVIDQATDRVGTASDWVEVK
ncbi:MAG: VWA domain-containing protein [Acidobacteriota bacterium]